jgi:hypothetical protein
VGPAGQPTTNPPRGEGRQKKSNWKKSTYLPTYLPTSFFVLFLLHIWAFRSKGISETPSKRLKKNMSTTFHKAIMTTIRFIQS